MDKITPENLSADTKVYLDDIADRLYSGHASIMIGAGFSKNAIPNGQKNKNFLDWNQLADIFFEKLNGRKPNDKERYLSPIKLAEEVQAAFGRTGLENLISDNLPDMEYSPSILHDQLVRLPWNNIFTTNYDTLIERATEKTERRFDIVRNQKDLVYSKNPRVVKLHGSFPSERPFIITEEDYRVYPSKYALYVNTVQQSLIENSLCLLGFSGDDPNFLHWLGWIRDNLGNDHSPRIYLVGVFNFSTSRRKLLEQKNISIIDFYSYLCDEKDQHKIAMRTFIDYLTSKEEEKVRIEWPLEEEKTSPLDDDRNLEENLRAASSLWKKTREEYPGWVVCPYKNRKKLWRNTERWLWGKHTKLDSTEIYLVNFWYEFIWRLDKCLMPLNDYLECEIRRIVEALNPFSNNYTEEDFALKEQWFYLVFSLLRFYREEGKSKEWNDLFVSVNLLNDLAEDITTKLAFERCYFNLYMNKIKDLSTSFEQLKGLNLAPFQQAKFASVLAEYGKFEEAHGLIEDSLNSVRSIQNLKPVTNDYQYLSEESYILQILKMIKDSRSFSEDFGKSRLSYIDEFLKRWNNLKEYECDPWGELEFFELKLADEPIEYKTSEVKESFDVGHRTVSHKLGGFDKELVISYNFLRFLEDAGIPLRVSQMNLGKDAVQGAIVRVQATSPSLAFSTLIRSGDDKVIDRLFDRQTIAKMSFKDVNDLLGSFLMMLSDSKELIEKSDRWKEGNIGTRIAHVLPEIVSRLIFKASDENRRLVLNFLIEVYRSEKKTNYVGICNLTKRLIEIWPYREFENLINSILDNLKPVLAGHPTLTREFIDPLLFVDTKVFKECGLNLNILPEKIDTILEKMNTLMNEERHSSFLRLAILHDLNLMSKGQEEKFGNIIWSKIEQDNFPDLGGVVPKSFYLTLPSPQNIQVGDLVKKMIVQLQLPFQIGNSVSIGARFEIFSEFEKVFSFLGKDIVWTEDDAIDLLDKVLAWISAEKNNYLKLDDSEMHLNRRNEFRSRFYKGIRLISFAVIPFLSEGKLSERENEILDIINELGPAGISMSILASQILIKLNDRQSLLDIIVSDLTSNDELVSDSAIYAVSLILTSAYGNNTLIKFQELIKYLIDPIFWNKHPQVIFCLERMSDLIIKEKVSSVELHIDEILSGLRRIRIEYTTYETRYVGSFNEVFSTRIEASRLARVLYKKCSNENAIIPDELQIWKKEMESHEEFLDLKKIWEA